MAHTSFRRTRTIDLSVSDQRSSFERHKIDAIIDVWCEAPVRKGLGRVPAKPALGEGVDHFLLRMERTCRQCTDY